MAGEEQLKPGEEYHASDPEKESPPQPLKAEADSPPGRSQEKPPETASAQKPAGPPKPDPSKKRITDSPTRKAKQDRAPDNDPGIWRMNRRNFLNVAGWMAFLTFIVTSIVGSLRYMFPRVLFEPPTKFTVGSPQGYVIGEVSEKYKDDHRVWIVREKDGFYALIAICTHLGCTPNWMESGNKFKCPCHGSGYYKSGVNFEGPTPRPLERAYIALGDDGQLEVDTSVTYRYELGQWGNPGAYYKYSGA